MSFQHIFVGGTFDRLHKGHEAVLTRALQDTTTATIGITSDEFVHSYKLDQDILPFVTRKKAVNDFISSHFPHAKWQIIEISDKYEPAASGDFDAIIVTCDNKTTADEINRQRHIKGIPHLALIEVEIVPGQDGSPISSTRIRNYLINPDGSLVLPQGLRQALKNPLGLIVEPQSIHERLGSNTCVITVGDVTTDVMLREGVVINLAVLDGKAERKPYKNISAFGFPESMQLVKVNSGPGFISQDAIVALKKWGELREPRVILVNGEDDLLVLPAIEYAPLEALVYYGQPHVGLVMVEVTLEIKNKVREILAKFNPEKQG